MKKCVCIFIAVFCFSAAQAATQDDIVVWSSANSDWYMNHTNAIQPYLDGVADSSSGWGAADDFSPLAGDVNGDGVDDIVVLRTSADNKTNWYAAHSTVNGSGVGSLGDGTNYSEILSLGTASANRVKNFLSNVNGDGQDDAVMVLNSGGALRWSAGHSTSAGLSKTTTSLLTSWGVTSTDIPLMGDFNGDSYVDAAVFRNDGGWHVAKSTASGLSTASTASGVFGGTAGDIPLVGDLNGDGRDDAVIVRNNGDGQAHWYVGYSNASGVVNEGNANWADLGNYGWLNVDTPLLADIDGDGKADLGVYRQTASSYSNWYFSLSGGGSATAANYGWYGDTPLIGQFDVIPEPATLALLGLGGLLLRYKSRK